MVAAIESARARGSWPRVIWAGVISLLAPGSGQIYARMWPAGVTIMVVSLLGHIGMIAFTRLVPPTPPGFEVFLILVLLGLCLIVCVAVHAGWRMRCHPETRRPTWYRSTWLGVALYIGLSSTLSLLLPGGWRSFSIPSGSGLPGIRVGDFVMADVRHAATPPERGDIVIFKYPRDPSIDYIKRVIGLPGDHVRLSGGQLWLNGLAIARQPAGELSVDEGGRHMVLTQYIETLPNGRSYAVVKTTDDGPFNNTPDYVVPAGSCFVLGDNRDNSADSRVMTAIGFVPLPNLVGKASTIYWSRDPARILTPVN